MDNLKSIQLSDRVGGVEARTGFGERKRRARQTTPDDATLDALHGVAPQGDLAR